MLPGGRAVPAKQQVSGVIRYQDTLSDEVSSQGGQSSLQKGLSPGET